MQASGIAGFDERKARLRAQLASAGDAPLRLAKRTSSNLFRYAPRERAVARLDLGDFDHVLAIDPAARTLDVEGLATFDTIASATLAQGLAPLVTPELKHITVGGAIVGIGIESNSFRHGFVHDGLIAAEVLVPDGRIVEASAAGEHADLLRALPNSYGTLGYVLRAKMRLMPARRYVHLHTTRIADVDAFVDGMRRAAESDADFVEGLIYDRARQLLTVSRFTDDPPHVDDIMRRDVFYKLIEARADVYLTTYDYLFRYDPEWFWNLPETAPYALFRRFAPKSMRNSGFYKRYVETKHSLLARLGIRPDDNEEPLIQDWEVPWPHAPELTRYALESVDLAGKPWIATVIRPQSSPPVYPVEAGALLYNLGCYCHVRRRPGEGRFAATMRMDRRCFDSGGVKMLYSSTFIDADEFARIYGGTAYAALKRKYDPHGRQPMLYEKCALRRA